MGEVEGGMVGEGGRGGEFYEACVISGREGGGQEWQHRSSIQQDKKYPA